MSTLLWLGRFTLLFASFTGWFLYLKRRWRLQPELIPVLCCTAIGSVMVLAGILNIITLTRRLIFGAGVLLLLYQGCVCLRARLAGDRDWRPLASLAAFFLLSAYFAFILRGSQFCHTDNYTHWAVVARDILVGEQLPNFQFLSSAYEAYPVGTACFIDYVCRVIGTSDACLCFAQCFLLLSAIFALFALTGRGNRWKIALAVIGGVYILIANIQINDLLVDTLLPALCLAGLAILIAEESRPRRAMPMASIVVTFIVSVKNSGLFFALLASGAALALLIRRRCLRGLWKEALLWLAALPLFFWYLWRQHVAYVYTQGLTSTHALSLQLYQERFGEKTAADISAISTRFWAQTLSPQNECLWVLGLLLLVLGVGLMLRKPLVHPKELPIAAASAASAALYELFLWGTYLFSMDTPDAAGLGSYQRYSQTLSIFLYGVMLIYLLRYFPWPRVKAKRALAALLCCLCLLTPILPHRGDLSMLIKPSQRRDQLRDRLEAMKLEWQIPYGKRYLLYRTDETPEGEWLVSIVSRYAFNAAGVTVCDSQTLSRALDRADDYDYMIIINRDEALQDTLNTRGYPLAQEAFPVR